MRFLTYLLFTTALTVPGPVPNRTTALVPLTSEPFATPPSTLLMNSEMMELARVDAVAFLNACVARYRREVTGYTTTLRKQEFLNGRLGPVEEIEVAFREDPFSVYMKWITPPAGRADRALYVEGANEGLSLARPAGRAARFLVGGIVARDPNGPDAKAAGRYTMPEFGIGKGTERTLDAWSKAQKKGVLRVEWNGVRTVAELGGMECVVLRRTCDPPEEDGVTSVEISIDTDYWLQRATVLTAGPDRLIGAYHFRNVAINPTFAHGQFSRQAILAD